MTRRTVCAAGQVPLQASLWATTLSHNPVINKMQDIFNLTEEQLQGATRSSGTRARCEPLWLAEMVSHRTGCARRGAGIRQRGVRPTAVGRDSLPRRRPIEPATTLRLVAPTGLGPRRAGWPGGWSRQFLTRPENQSRCQFRLPCRFRRLRHRPPTKLTQWCSRLGTYLLDLDLAKAAFVRGAEDR